jgi:hypothetical protein
VEEALTHCTKFAQLQAPWCLGSCKADPKKSPVDIIDGVTVGNQDEINLPKTITIQVGVEAPFARICSAVANQL